MRIFVAVNLPDRIKDYLYNLEKSIGNDLAKINWVAKKNLHLTMKFLGEIEDDKVEEIKLRLRVVKLKKIKTCLNNLGWFPNENRINVIWIGLKPDEKIIELQRKIDELVINSYEQKFSAHITLGRVKFVRNKEKFLNMLNDINVDNLEFEINEFVLVKSTLTKDGPRYEVLGTYSLD